MDFHTGFMKINYGLKVGAGKRISGWGSPS